MGSEYKSFMAEGYSIGAHAESLYSRGYKHYGTMGQGNKQVHIFTPAKGKVTHHMLLKHDGADPARHEGQPDLKKIKGMTEETDVIGIQKARETKAQRQDRNVQEEDTLEEGWLFGSRYKKIGNKSGSTHRVTFKHLPTDSKHTVDVTAPTDRHAEAHVHRHVLGGRNGTAPIRITRMQHLHEGTEVMKEDDIHETSEMAARAGYASRALLAAKKPPQSKIDKVKAHLQKPNYDPKKHDTRLRSFYGSKTLAAAKKQLSESEDNLSETTDPRDNLPIRYAVNHPDSQARHHAREYKKSITAYNAGHAKLASQHRAPTRDQEDELMNHYEVAAHHHREYKKRLGQLEAGKNKNEDLMSEGYQVKHLGTDGPMEPDDEGELRYYRVSKNGKKVGELTHGTYFGSIHGTLHGKRLPDIGQYNGQGPDAKLHRFLKSNTGKKWSSNLHKYQSKNEDLSEADDAPHPKGTRVVVTHKGHQKPGRVIRHDKGGPDSSPFYIVDVGEYGSGKFMAHQVKKEGLDEGLVSKITNAAKNLNKKTKGSDQRFSDAREKASFDKATGTDLSPRGRALRKIEKLQWSKQNPVKAPKPIVPMGKLPDKVWSTDSDKPKPKRVTDDSLDQPMFRKAGAMSRRFKTEDVLDEAGYAHVAALDRHITDAEQEYNKNGLSKAHTHHMNNAYSRAGRLNGMDWAANPELKERYKTQVSKWLHMNPKYVRFSEEVIEEGLTVAVPVEIDGKKYSAVNGQAYVHSNMIMGRWNTKKRPMRKALKPGAHHDKIIAALEKHKSEKYREEELEIRQGQKLLKEKPKRGADGKLIKSKAAQRVEDCIKMSGKKQKIDTEPSYNPLTTAGGGGTPNA